MTCELGQFFTEEAISQLLVSHLPSRRPRVGLDLGAGEGALLGALSQRWPTLRLLGAEIHGPTARRLRRRFPEAHLVCGDGLRDCVPRKLALEPGSVDIAVCNPPFKRLEITTRSRQLLIEAGLSGAQSLRTLTSDLLFLAQNLKLLRKGGLLGIILPDTLVAGKEFCWLREDLLDHHAVLGIIELPRGVFRGTEARTHILILAKEAKTPKLVSVARAQLDGTLTESLDIQSSMLSERMDHHFLQWKSCEGVRRRLDLNGVGADIKRGSRTVAELVESGHPYLHTTDLSPTPISTWALGQRYNPDGLVVAKRGDILVARVGRQGCVGRLARITSGSLPISDCLYRIRVSKKHQKQVWSMLTSEYGSAWINAHAHGVCASVLSKSDLLRFPL